MARDRLTFRQRDLAAALKATKAAGVPVARIEVRKQGIVIFPGEPEPGKAADSDPRHQPFDFDLARKSKGEMKGSRCT
jgi:hypothetical protein